MNPEDLFFKKNPNSKKNYYKEIIIEALKKDEKYLLENHSKEQIEEFINYLEKQSLEFSNDFYFNYLINCLIANSFDQELTNTILDIFIGKTKVEKNSKYQFSIGAMNKFDHDYNLIRMTEKFDYLINTIIGIIVRSICLQTLQVIEQKSPNIELLEKDIELGINYLLNLKNKKETTVKWNIYDLPELNISYKNYSLLSFLTVQLQLSSHAFLLFHEMAHHHLKHTDFNKIKFDIEDYPEILKVWNGEKNQDFIMEYQSDSYAIYSLFYKLYDKHTNISTFGLLGAEMITGIIICFLAMFVLDEDIYKDSDYHPASVLRIIHVFKMIKYFTNIDFFSEFGETFILNFSILLNKIDSNYLKEIEGIFSDT